MCPPSPALRRFPEELHPVIEWDTLFDHLWSTKEHARGSAMADYLQLDCVPITWNKTGLGRSDIHRVGDFRHRPPCIVVAVTLCPVGFVSFEPNLGNHNSLVLELDFPLQYPVTNDPLTSVALVCLNSVFPPDWRSQNPVEKVKLTSPVRPRQLHEAISPTCQRNSSGVHVKSVEAHQPHHGLNSHDNGSRELERGGGSGASGLHDILLSARKAQSVSLYRAWRTYISVKCTVSSIAYLK